MDVIEEAHFLFLLLNQGIVVPVLAVLCAILGLLLADARRQARVLTARVSTLETRLAPGTTSSQPAAPPPAVAHGDAPAPVGIVILLFEPLAKLLGWRRGALLNSPGEHPFGLDPSIASNERAARMIAETERRYLGKRTHEPDAPSSVGLSPHTLTPADRNLGRLRFSGRGRKPFTSGGEDAVQAILASASGAEAEYAAAFGARPGHVPMDLWEGDRPRPTPETGAATPAPATAAYRMRTIDPSPRSNTTKWPRGAISQTADRTPPPRIPVAPITGPRNRVFVLDPQL